MKYCQGPKCHEYKTKDRIRGHKGDKHYETRKRSSFYYMNGNCCSFQCQSDWFNKFGEMALDRFGRTHEPKISAADSSWYKDYRWVHGGNHQHNFINDLLGERRPITREQYNDKDLVRPN